MIQLDSVSIRSFDDILFQEKAVKSLQKGIDADDQVYLLWGPSGVGKTSLAKLYAFHHAYNQKGSSIEDTHEINCSHEGSAEKVRGLVDKFYDMPITDHKSVFILDEAQSLSKQAQTSLMNALENLPPTTIVFICTMDRSKLHEALISRARNIQLKPFGTEDLDQVMPHLSCDRDYAERAARAAKGNYRYFLKLIDQGDIETSDRETAAKFLHSIIMWDHESLVKSSKTILDVDGLYHDLLDLMIEIVGIKEGMDIGDEYAVYVADSMNRNQAHDLHEAALDYHKHSEFQYPNQCLSLALFLRGRM